MSTQKISSADVLSEFLEVVIHNILYRKKIYPETIFTAKRKYGIAVYQSIHPDVNEYINQCMKAVTFHARRKQLKRLFLCFNSDQTIFEKYIFEVLNLNNCVEGDTLLVDLEQSMRNFILKLHSTQVYLEDLPDDATFSIRLQTTLYSSVEFNQEPSFEDFPWIELREKENTVSSADIVPLYTVDTSFLSLQMLIEKEG